MADKWDIPVIDIRRIGLENQNKIKLAKDGQGFTMIGEALVAGLKQYGVVYLINHGVEKQKLLTSRRMAREFFELPNDVKVISHRRQSNISSGWLDTGMEYSGNDYTETEQQGDLKQSINISVADLDKFPWPDETTLPNFRKSQRLFFEECIDLSKRLMLALEMTLSPEKNTIGDGHKRIGGRGNYSHGKHLYYPPVDKGLSDDKMRLNEHKDWGTFTLLFQDECGGLQMRDREGETHHAEPLDGAVLLQAADMLQRWTSDQIWSMPHRVAILPENRDKPRESTVFFVTPDDGYQVTCLDGSDTYPPTEMVEYTAMMAKKFQKDDGENFDQKN